MENLCNGTNFIEVTHGMHIGTSYRCPGCSGCNSTKLKKSEKLKILTPQEVRKQRNDGGWIDGQPS